MKQSKFLMIRLAARIMLYFAMFSYRGNNEVAGHAVALAREPIEQGVGACHAVSNRKYQDLPTLVQKINDHFFIALTLKCFCSSCFRKACCQNQNLLNPNASCDLKKKAGLNLSV